MLVLILVDVALLLDLDELCDVLHGSARRDGRGQEPDHGEKHRLQHFEGFEYSRYENGAENQRSQLADPLQVCPTLPRRELTPDLCALIHVQRMHKRH